MPLACLNTIGNQFHRHTYFNHPRASTGSSTKDLAHCPCASSLKVARAQSIKVLLILPLIRIIHALESAERSIERLVAYPFLAAPCRVGCLIRPFLYLSLVSNHFLAYREHQHSTHIGVGPAIRYSSSDTKIAKNLRNLLMHNSLLILLYTLVLTSLAACTSTRVAETPSEAAANPSSDVVKSATSEQMECRREKVMGSNLTQRVCYPKSSSGEDEMSKTQIAKVDEAEDQMICRKEKVMGSNLRKRVCYRKKDRESRNRSDQDDYREMSTRAISPGSSNLD